MTDARDAERAGGVQEAKVKSAIDMLANYRGSFVQQNIADVIDALEDALTAAPTEGGRDWKALFEVAHGALICIAETQADYLYARKVADELTVAALTAGPATAVKAEDDAEADFRAISKTPPATIEAEEVLKAVLSCFGVDGVTKVLGVRTAALASPAATGGEAVALRHLLATFREFVLHNVTQTRGWGGHPIWPLVAEAIGPNRCKFDKGDIWKFIQHDNQDASLYTRPGSPSEPASPGAAMLDVSAPGDADRRD